MNELTDSTEQNYSTNLIALPQSVNQLSDSEIIAQQIVTFIEMPNRAMQSTQSRVRFDNEPQQCTSQSHTPKTLFQRGLAHQNQLLQHQQTYMQMHLISP